MSKVVDARTCIVVPNWNGADSLASCIESLRKQSLKAHIIVVDNGSVDGSLTLLEKYSDIEVIKRSRNLGFAGGVNAGFRQAINQGFEFVASFNNDAVADESWLENLVVHITNNPAVGIATCKLLNNDGAQIDSTGDYYTAWGLPYPRGRGESDINKYDLLTEIFAASGGASLYRIKMLKEIGLFDEKFFAYYEDVDLSFRAQLAGWKVIYSPASLAYHQIGATSKTIKGFTTFQTLKNLPLLFYKNVPRRYLFVVGFRLYLVTTSFFIRAVSRGQGWYAIKGAAMAIWLFPRSLSQRRKIQKNKKVTDEYIWSMVIHDLPPNARTLRKLRNRYWKLTGKG